MRTTLVLMALLLSGCGAGEPGSSATGTPSPEAGRTSAGAVEATVAQAAPSPVQMAQWTRNCALCHVRGEGGAPVLGDEAAWAERSTQGAEVLLAHTLEGFNNMPPLGYCMDCEEADFRVLIRFMGGER
jgi:cytochrome c5